MTRKPLHADDDLNVELINILVAWKDIGITWSTTQDIAHGMNCIRLHLFPILDNAVKNNQVEKKIHDGTELYRLSPVAKTKKTYNQRFKIHKAKDKIMGIEQLARSAPKELATMLTAIVEDIKRISNL